MRLVNYHTHTTFCDGKNSPEEMVLAAIRANITDLGFSSHAMWPFASTWHLSASRYEEYIGEIARLKALYEGKISLLCGFEADYRPGASMPDAEHYAQFSPDFLIGSVHYVEGDRQKGKANLWCVDAPTEEVARGLDLCFNGDGKKAVQTYWRTVRDMVSSCDFDIVAHLDVLRKRNGTLRFFDESVAWYKKELVLTAKAIARTDKIVELNTGALSRKTMDGIYPSDDFLSILYTQGVPITLSSDTHSVEHMTFAYDKAREAAIRAGYSTISRKDIGAPGTSPQWVQDPL